MKERGLGTPATRAEIIETLLRRGYAQRQGKALAATDTGIRLVDLVHPQVKSAALTGEWEAQLARIRSEGGPAAGVHGADRGLRARPRRADALAEALRPCRAPRDLPFRHIPQNRRSQSPS